MIFEEGNKHEFLIKRDLEDAGIKITGEQKNVNFPKYRVTGRLDFMTRFRRRNIIIEFKTISGNLFPKINSPQDLIDSKYPHHQQYIPQIQLYMKAENCKYGIFIFKNKNNGELKEIHVDFDNNVAMAYLNHASALNKRIDKIRAVLKESYDFEDIADFDCMEDVKDLEKIKQEAYELIEKYLPTRVNDLDICEHCNFQHICLPDEIRREQFRLMVDDKLEEILNRRENLKEHAKSYDKLDKEAKKLIKGAGWDHLFCGDFEITVRVGKKTSIYIKKKE